MENWVHKATNSKTMPPKRKHVRNIIMDTWKDMSGYSFLIELFKRPLEQSEITCWKGLITAHTVIQQGHPRVLEDSCLKVSFFETLKNSWSRHSGATGNAYPRLISIYCGYILEKLTFHQLYKDFPSDFALEKYTKQTKDRKMNPELTLQCVIHMLDLQSSINSAGKAILDTVLDECKAAGLLPLVVESYNLYTLEVTLIKRLVSELDSVDVLSHLIERFYSQYINLRKFYFDVSNIKWVTSIIAVPMLPKDPPVFSKPKELTSPRYRRQTEPTPKPNPTPAPAPAPVRAPEPRPAPVQTAPVQQMNYPVVHHNPHLVPTFNPGPMTQAVVPVSQAVVTHQPPPPAQNIAPVDNRNRSSSVGRETNFNDLVAMVNSMKGNPTKKNEEEDKRKLEDEKRRKDQELRLLEIRKKEEADRKRLIQEEEKRQAELRKKQVDDSKRIEEEKKRAEEESRRKKEEEERKRAEALERAKREAERLTVEKEKIRQIVEEEASKEIRELKVKIVELENSVEREKEQNKDNSREIADLQAKLQRALEELEKERKINKELRQIIEQRDATIAKLTESHRHATESHESVKAELVRLQKSYVEENARSMIKELDSAKDSIDMYLNRFDNPTNLGNPSATPADVIDDTGKVAKESEAFITNVINNAGREIFIDGVRAVASVTSTLLDDAKGASRRIEDNEMRQKLLDAARHAGEATQSLVDLVRQLEGQVENEEEKKMLLESLQNSKQGLAILSQVAQDSEKIPEEIAGEDLEALAEKELMAAAKIIEQAANDLMSARGNKKPAEPGTPDVAASILEAAMAITKATGMLVNAAAVAQKDRVEKGRQSSGAMYRRDPTWSQGLISAAKSVANATAMLVKSANDAVNGKVDEESLIAASKAVASSTAQLVAATRAKSDPNSASQLKLGTAAKAVTDATSMLVAAARAAAARKQEEQVEFSMLSEMQRKVKEMEIQAEILRIEKELDNTRKRLFSLRKEQYQ